MTVSYLDTVFTIDAAGADGVAYATLTRAMKVHVRSLIADEVAASYSADGEAVSLDTEGAVICITAKGSTYVEAMIEAGLITDPATAPAQKRTTARKPKAARRGKGKATAAVVPSPTESVVSPVLAKGTTATRRVPGGSQDTLAIVKDEDRMGAIEAQLAALMDMLATV